jgi:hypothetical protein
LGISCRTDSVGADSHHRLLKVSLGFSISVYSLSEISKGANGGHRG